MKKYIVTKALTLRKFEDFRNMKTNVEANGQEDMQVSDGYHTMDELYEHRIALFIALCKHFTECYDGGMYTPPDVWRSKLHHDGTMFDDCFILGIAKNPGEQITYHLPIERWEHTEFAETLDRAPEWDGHTPADFLERLKNL